MNAVRANLALVILTSTAVLAGCVPGARRGGTGGNPVVRSAVPDSRTVRWNELLAVVDHKVALSLEGAWLEGRVEAVTAGDLVLEVEETSNAVAYPTGRTRLPRSEVSSLIVWTTTRRESAMGEKMGGYAASGGLLGLGALGSSRGGHVLGRMAAGLGGVLAGALVGRQLDKEEVHTVLHVIPEPAEMPVRESP